MSGKVNNFLRDTFALAAIPHASRLESEHLMAALQRQSFWGCKEEETEGELGNVFMTKKSNQSA